MTNNLIGRPKAGSLLWPAAFLASAGGAGLWLALAHDSVQVLLAAAVLALIAVLGSAWLFRERAARRLRAALVAYTEREIYLPGSRKAPQGGVALATKGSDWQNRRAS
jgi:hypothetical protein